MSITKDATKGWALPASAAEFTELLAGTGIANPDHAWKGQVASGNLSDLIGSLTLTARGTPLYSQAATGWSSTGVGADDNTTDGFTAASGVGPSPATTSQVWFIVLSLEVEPTATRTLIGMNPGASGFSINFVPAAGTNKIRAAIAGVTADGAADHAVGSYVFALRYDRAASVAKISSDLEAVAGLYSAALVDGQKGFGPAATTVGSATVLYMLMYEGANAEALSDANITTIRARIESPPTFAGDDDFAAPNFRPTQVVHRLSLAALDPADLAPLALLPIAEEYLRRPVPAPAPVIHRITPLWDPAEAPPRAVMPVDECYVLRPLPAPVPVRHRVPAVLDLPEIVPQPEPRPGPTLTMLQAGSSSYKWVVALEGYPYLLTDASPAEAVSAWSGRDWTQALGNLTVNLDNEQRLNPWEPLLSGGELTLHVLPDAGDTFGVDVGRKTAGDETMLDTTVDKDDVSLTVKATSSFDGSGPLYIGTEALSYTGKTSSTFSGVSRGKFAPFTVDGGSSSRWGHLHQVADDPNGVRLRPLVTEQPRVWLGKWLGLWMHRVTASGRLNTRDDARLTFAGRVAELEDDANTMATVLHVEHVLDVVKRAVIGRDMFTAKAKDGMYLAAGLKFTLEETTNGGASWNEANPCLVKVGATGTDIEEGFYSAAEIHSKLNAYFAAERTALRITGTFCIGIAPHGNDGLRTYFSYRIGAASGTDSVGLFFTLPKSVNHFFGTMVATSGQTGNAIIQSWGDGSTDYDIVGEDVPLRYMLLDQNVGITDFQHLELEEERGTFVDQIDSIPGFPNLDTGFEWGVFLIDGHYLMVAAKQGSTLTNILNVPIQYAGTQPITVNKFFETAERTIDDESGPISVKQIIINQTTLGLFLKQLFYSTGTSGYNHPTFDVLPATVGLGLPGELLGDSFENSVDALPGADAPYVLLLDEPKTLAELLRGTLIFRWAFLRWKDEGLQFCTWSTPTTSSVIFTESNKAAPASRNENHRTASALSAEWQRQIIKVDYDRNLTAVEKNGGYRSSMTVVDRVAEDDSGGDPKTITLQLPDTYGDAGVEALKSNFLVGAALFTRSITKLARSLDSRFWEGVAVGDTVMCTDAFARDPDTGRRGVATRPALVIAHSWNPGGSMPSGGVADMSGEITLLVRDVLRVAAYVPSAQLDEAATNAGYIVGTKVATCKPHAFSESTEAADATNFPAGTAVRFVERDPADPAAPSTHDDAVAAQSGNTITLTLGFAAFDNTKKYNVMFDTFGNGTAAQQALAYQADDADGLIEDTRAPFEYVAGFASLPYTANSAGDEVELPANITFADSTGRDVATDVAVNRLINNLIDYKTAHVRPFLTNNEMSGAAATGTYLLVHVRPINLTADMIAMTQHVNRALKVAPMMKSSDGSSASVRVSLVRYMPNDDTLNDVNRGNTLAEAVFTTTNPTLATMAAVDLPIGRIKTPAGNCFLLIECTVKARCRGLGICQEGPRT